VPGSLDKLGPEGYPKKNTTSLGSRRFWSLTPMTHLIGERSDHGKAELTLQICAQYSRKMDLFNSLNVALCSLKRFPLGR